MSGRPDANELTHDRNHDFMDVAPAFLDKKMIGDLLIAIMTNKIPPECMIGVRRFLAQVAAEENAKKIS